MDARPKASALATLSQTPSLAALGAASPSPTALLSEEALYPLTTAFVPKWVTHSTRPADLRKGARTAATLFGSPCVSVPGFSLQWDRCFPELLTVAQAFHPGYNGEVKSARSSGDTANSPKMYDELVTYVTLGIIAALFRDVPDGHRRFFSRPPVGYGLAAFPHVGYLIAVEWIGRLFMSIVSQPFFLGSREHKAAVAVLPDCDYTTLLVDLPVKDVPVMAWPADDTAPRVLWRSEGADGDTFFKVIAGNGFTADYFERMSCVYSALAEVWGAVDTNGDAPPPSLVRPRLLYGAGEVCVTMPWVDGRDALPSDLEEGGCAVRPVAAAIVWLARRGLLYTDLRAPTCASAKG